MIEELHLNSFIKILYLDENYIDIISSIIFKNKDEIIKLFN